MSDERQETYRRLADKVEGLGVFALTQKFQESLVRRRDVLDLLAREFLVERRGASSPVENEGNSDGHTP